MARPWVIAHRGDSAHAPENSDGAFAMAVASGADAIETDVRLSKDGIPVLCHDATLQRIAGIDRLLADCTAAELAALELLDREGDPQPGVGIPRLADALLRHPQLPFFLEMKGEDLRDAKDRRALAEATADAALSAVAQGGAAPLLLSFEEDLLEMAHAAAPSLSFGRNLEHPLKVEADFLSCSLRTLTSAFVLQAHGADKPVLAFTVNEAATLRRALAFRVDGIFSDDPRWLREQLQLHFGDR